MEKKAKIVIAALIVLCVYLAFANFQLNNKFKTFEKAKQVEFKEKLAKARELIRQDLQGKYSADIVSYQAMVKRLEIEKNKVKELEAKTKSK